MKRIALIATTSLMFATAASAGGITFSLPNLSFPTAADATVAKDCMPQGVTLGLCTPQE